MLKGKEPPLPAGCAVVRAELLGVASLSFWLGWRFRTAGSGLLFYDLRQVQGPIFGNDHFTDGFGKPDFINLKFVGLDRQLNLRNLHGAPAKVGFLRTRLVQAELFDPETPLIGQFGTAARLTIAKDAIGGYRSGIEGERDKRIEIGLQGSEVHSG